MYKNNKFFIIAFCSVLFALSLFLFVSIENMFFDVIPIYVNVIRAFLFLSIVFLFFGLVQKKRIKKSIQIILAFLIVIVLSLDSFVSYDSFNADRNTSVSNESYEIEDELKNLLPFYNDFYGEEAYYAFSIDSTIMVDRFQISNRPHTLKVNSSSYNVCCYNSKSILLKAKITLDNALSRLKEGYVLLEEFNAEDTDNSFVKIYSNSTGYLACFSSNNVFATIELKYMKNISLSVFNEIVRAQFPLIQQEMTEANWNNQGTIL